MSRELRCALAVCAAVALLLAPFGSASAEPGRGRDKPPGHERDEEGPHSGRTRDDEAPEEGDDGESPTESDDESAEGTPEEPDEPARQTDPPPDDEEPARPSPAPGPERTRSGSASDLTLAQRAPLLVQVGDSGDFAATVTNTGMEPLEEVAVVAEIAPELDVVGVAPVAGADAIELGSSPAGEDIVWIFEVLAPGEEIELTWTARAVAPGDLEASTAIAATVGAVPVETERQSTYLGFVRGVRVERGAVQEPVVRQQVVTELVPVTREVSASTGALLPVTGASPVPFTAVALVLMVIGALCIARAHSRGPGARLVTGILLVGLVLTACVSDQPPMDGGGAVAPQPADEPTDEKQPKDRVLGVRIERERPEAGSGDEPLEVEPGTGADTVTEVVMQEVTRTELVEVVPEELPVEQMASRAGDNTVAIHWTPAGPVSVTSGRTLTAGAGEEILVSVGAQGDRLVATVTLRNLGNRRLAVDGTLVLEVASGSGSTATLTSSPIHTVLGPGGETTADFTFALPAGSYASTGSFRAY